MTDLVVRQSTVPTPPDHEPSPPNPETMVIKNTAIIEHVTTNDNDTKVILANSSQMNQEVKDETEDIFDVGNIPNQGRQANKSK